jgi:hypothetical protein
MQILILGATFRSGVRVQHRRRLGCYLETGFEDVGTQRNFDESSLARSGFLYRFACVEVAAVPCSVLSPFASDVVSHE